MTLEDLADIHARAMTVPEPWTAITLKSFVDAHGAVLETSPHGFAIGRVIADEAELLTLAVDPDHQGQGEGRTCLAGFEAAAAKSGALEAFLEVAETNAAARALYASAGWEETGRRRDYYRAGDGSRIDALLMRKALSGI